MVSLIDELECAHRVVRVRDEADRRRYAVTLTPEGERTLKTADEIATRTQDRFLGALDEGQ